MSPRELVDVSIVAFSSLVREGICRILSESEFQNYHIHDTVEEAVSSALSERIAISLVDIRTSDDSFPDLSLLKAHSPSARIVLMVESFHLKQMVAAFKAGADAYLLKEIGSEPLIDSLRLVMRGEKVIPSALLQHLPDTQMLSESRTEVQLQLGELLSEREIDTLRCLVMGYPNKIIAYRLDISEATVKVHVKAILRKLTVQNRTQAAIWAVNQGLVNHSGDFREYTEAVKAQDSSPAAQVSNFRSASSLAFASPY